MHRCGALLGHGQHTMAHIPLGTCVLFPGHARMVAGFIFAQIMYRQPRFPEFMCAMSLSRVEGTALEQSLSISGFRIFLSIMGYSGLMPGIESYIQADAPWLFPSACIPWKTAAKTISFDGVFAALYKA